jgi:hypothetical protein
MYVFSAVTSLARKHKKSMIGEMDMHLVNFYETTNRNL